MFVRVGGKRRPDVFGRSPTALSLRMYREGQRRQRERLPPFDCGDHRLCAPLDLTS